MPVSLIEMREMLLPGLWQAAAQPFLVQVMDKIWLLHMEETTPYEDVALGEGLEDYIQRL